MIPMTSWSWSWSWSSSSSSSSSSECFYGLIFSLPANTSAMTGRPMGGLSPGAMLDLPNHQPKQFLKPKFPTSPSFSFEVLFFCWSTQKQFSTTSMGMSWKFAAGKQLATQMGRVCPGCSNYEPLKFPGLAKILHGICSESWDPLQKQHYSDGTGHPER